MVKVATIWVMAEMRAAPVIVYWDTIQPPHLDVEAEGTPVDIAGFSLIVANTELDGSIWAGGIAFAIGLQWEMAMQL